MVYATLHRGEYSAQRFDRLYQLDRDPFGVEHTACEQRKQELLLRLVRQRTYHHTLDVGCGTGVISRRIAASCDCLVGIDFSPEAIAQARKKCSELPNLSFLVEDIRRFHMAEHYDLIVCSEVLYYLSPPDLEQVIARLAEHTSPDGWLILVGKAGESYVCPRLARRFQQRERIEEYTWKRPFALSVWERSR
jgi:predicted TPR repeat methyltransferase